MQHYFPPQDGCGRRCGEGRDAPVGAELARWASAVEEGNVLIASNLRHRRPDAEAPTLRPLPMSEGSPRKSHCLEAYERIATRERGKAAATP
jgi:hypothetical protein